MNLHETLQFILKFFRQIYYNTNVNNISSICYSNITDQVKSHVSMMIQNTHLYLNIFNFK